MLSKQQYIQMCKQKLNQYNFPIILNRPTYGTDRIKMELSSKAYQLLEQYERNVYFSSEFISDYFKLNGWPIYEKVIDFFSIYGGRNYYYDRSKNNIFATGGYDILSFPWRMEEKDENFYFDCMKYHYAGDFGPHIDQDGRIYRFCMGTYYKTADSIAEFMEGEICYVGGQEDYKDNSMRNRQNIEQHNVYQRVYEYLLPYVIRNAKMVEPLLPLILEGKIVLDNKQVDELMGAMSYFEDLPEELMMDIIEYLGKRDYTQRELLKMIDVVSKIKLSERKEQFLIDKLCTYEERYPKIKDYILKLL